MRCHKRPAAPRRWRFRRPCTCGLLAWTQTTGSYPCKACCGANAERQRRRRRAGPAFRTAGWAVEAIQPTAGHSPEAPGRRPGRRLGWPRAGVSPPPQNTWTQQEEWRRRARNRARPQLRRSPLLHVPSHCAVTPRGGARPALGRMGRARALRISWRRHPSPPRTRRSRMGRCRPLPRREASWRPLLPEAIASPVLERTVLCQVRHPKRSSRGPGQLQ